MSKWIVLRFTLEITVTWTFIKGLNERKAIRHYFARPKSWNYIFVRLSTWKSYSYRLLKLSCWSLGWMVKLTNVYSFHVKIHKVANMSAKSFRTSLRALWIEIASFSDNQRKNVSHMTLRYYLAGIYGG